MKYLYDYVYNSGIPLKSIGIFISTIFIIYSFVLYKIPKKVKSHLTSFHRNDKLGIFLVIFAFIWTIFIWTNIDLGEYYMYKNKGVIFFILMCVGVCIYFREFISVRALGFLMILGALPILESTFLESFKSRIILVIISYSLVIIGMLFVSSPYLFRDSVIWILSNNQRYNICNILLGVLGILILILSIFVW